MKKILAASIWLVAALATSSSFAQETQLMTTDAEVRATAQQLVDRHFEIWNDRNSAQRMEKFTRVYTPDVQVADYKALATGYSAINQLIDRVQQEHQGFAFSPEPVVVNHGLVRVRWGFGPKDQPNKVRGEDIFTMREGKLGSLHVFLDVQ
jgi:hypothetical protein